MIALIKTLQVILALSILIILHEFGHFTFAKLFHIRVDKFYLFFDIGDKRLLKFRIGETEYGIGWLPLGGYCKIAGMVDESMDLESLKKKPQDWEFRTHPAWQRLLVMAGGVLYNFIFAIAVYCAIMGIWGKSYISNEDAHIAVNELAYEMGFRDGDHIIRFDDYEPENFGMLQADLARRNVSKAVVLRDTDTLDIYIDHALIGNVLNSPLMFDLALPFVIDSVVSTTALDAGLMKGDRICAIGGTDVRYVNQARPLLQECAGDSTVISVVRADGQALDVTAYVDTSAMLGVTIKNPSICTERYDFLSAIPAGFNMAMETVGGYLSDLRLLARPSTGAYKSVGSFIAIGQVFPSSWDWYQFMSILALLSIMLGVMNLIPIPGLDGGHIVFVLYEMITGRKPSEKFLVITQYIGLFLLLMLMLLAFGNDFGRLIH